MRKRKIQTTKNKSMAILIALILIITMTLTSTLTSNSIEAEAQLAAQQPVSGPLPSGITVSVTADSAAYLSTRPNPVGLGQTFLINMWLNPPPHAYRQFLDYKLSVTKPDGTIKVYTMNSYVADGTNWMELVADQIGEWKLQMDFPGIYFPAGRYLDGKIITASTGGAVYEAVYVKPSQTPVTKLIVQQEPAEDWPESPLPTDYWTRPINAELREWWPIIGNYPWFGPGGGKLWNELYPNTNPYANPGQSFTPWVQGPNSPHVVWKREGALGGIVGGDNSDNSVYWPTTGWQNAPTIILWGRGYHAVTKPSATGPSGTTWWQCYDIRTGELFWERPLYTGESEPNLIEYGFTSVPPVPGVSMKPDSPYLLSISNGYLRKYDAFNGYMINNISISPMTGSGGTYYMNGHVLGIQDLGSAAGSARYRLINWTTFGTDNFAARIVSNNSYSRSSMPSAANIDWNVGLGATVTNYMTGGISTHIIVSGYNAYTGQSLWNTTIQEPLFSGSACIADHGKIAVITTRGYCYGVDLASGSISWKTEQFDYPYDATGWGSYSTISGYGNFYWLAQTGVYSIDWTTGKINWKFEKPMPYQYEGDFIGADGETVYPNHAPGLLADGTLFIPSSLHSPESPYYRGLKTFAIDAFTGEEKWSLGISVAGQHTRSSLQLRVADGYLTIGARDGYMYVVGKGLSATSISAPPLAVEVGKSFTITGTVLDLSPAQPGTAAIADEYMDAWMQYIHVQMPKPSNATGVTVDLTALDPNGNLIDVGKATCDTNGEFGLTWAPEVPGLYKLVATFNGTNSYGSSIASTYLTAIDVPTPTPQATSLPTSVADNYFVPAIAGLFVFVAIIGVVIILVLRKRP
jgi:hypothetical protein